MTITINVPVFPLRKEIAARKRRLRLPFCLAPRGGKDGAGEAPANSRYTEAGLEFDVTGIARHPRGPKGN